MVGGVDSSAGSYAYLKGAQLGSSANTPRNKPQESTYAGKESSPAPAPSAYDNVKESESAYKKTDTSSASSVPSTESVSTTRPTGETRSAPAPSGPDQTTELQARNDNSTLQTEQTRGSLLDIAV